MNYLMCIALSYEIFKYEYKMTKAVAILCKSNDSLRTRATQTETAFGDVFGIFYNRTEIC